MKKLLIVLLAMVFAFSLAACGGGGDKDGDSGKDKKAERVTTASGAISVEALDMPDYITKAQDDDEDILMAKEGEGYGVGDYVLISGISKDDETSLSYPSYVKGQEYTLDMLLSDFQNKNSYKTYTKTKIGDQEYVLLDEDSNRYYYTVTNNYPVLIQVIGESMQDNEAVTKSLESIQYNYEDPLVYDYCTIRSQTRWRCGVFPLMRAHHCSNAFGSFSVCAF